MRAIRSEWSRWATGVVLTAGATFSVTGAAQATSCAAAPDGSARAIVTGAEQIWTERPFFEVYDFAVTATVTAIVTDDDSTSPTYGATDVHVDVINGFGTSSIPESMVVSQSDPGWMNGYAFEVGDTYFIPIRVVGPNGEPNHSFVCDPISLLTADEAASLAGLAGDGIAVAVPGAGGTPPTGSPGSASDPSLGAGSDPGAGSPVAWLIGGALGAVVAAGAWTTGSRRRRHRVGIGRGPRSALPTP